MAIFKSNMLSAIRGSVNGTVYSQNKSGAYMRNRSMVVNPNTASQQLARSSLASAAQGWASLTEAQREGWRQYAAATPVTNRLGDTIYLSGANMYTKTNAFAQFIGIAFIQDAPSVVGLAEAPNWDPDEFPVLTDASSLFPNGITNFQFVTGTGSVNVAAQYAFWISGPVSAGVTFHKGPWNYVGKSLGNARLADKTSPYPLVEGEYRFVKVRVLDEFGRLSRDVQTSALLVENVP
jgi:hypothetical protein